MAGTGYDEHEYDVVIIGAGGAGLRAAIESARQGAKTAIITKSLLGKAHTVMAEGGCAAALANADDRDGWKVHFHDTMKGSKYLADWRMAELHAKEAPDRVRELEQWGAVFDRTPSQVINQRNFGGHTFPRLAHVGETGEGVASEVALVDDLRGRAVEHRAPLFELPHAVGRLLRVKFSHPPVGEVFAALHRVMEVNLPTVAVVRVGEGRGAAAFGHDGVRLAEQRLGDDRGLRALASGFDGRAQTGATGADDDHVVLMFVVSRAGHVRHLPTEQCCFPGWSRWRRPSRRDPR